MIPKGHCDAPFSIWKDLNIDLTVDRELEQTSWGPFYFLELFNLSLCLFAMGKSVL